MKHAEGPTLCARMDARYLMMIDRIIENGRSYQTETGGRVFMKRFAISIIAWVLSFSTALCSSSVAFAEEAKRVDFAEMHEMLSSAFEDFNEYSEDMLEELQPTISVVCADIFFALYAVEGDTINFDGYVHSAQDGLVICPGNYEEKSTSSWGFIVDDATSYQELNLADGDNVVITADVVGRNDDHMVVLKNVYIERRATATGLNPGVEESLILPETKAEASFEEAFAEMLERESSFDEHIEQFATDYKGHTIEFDGFIYECDENWPNRENYDLIVCNGDFENRPEHFKYFMFENVSVNDFGFEGTEFPSFVEYSSNVHVVGQIMGYKDDLHGYILLSPVSIEHRNPFTDWITDTTMYAELAKGNKGEAVRALQQRLVDLKYLTGKVDGQYGNQTKAAIEKFQKACGIEATGIADPITQAVLFSDKAPEAKLSVSCSSVVVGSSAKTVWYVDGQEFTLTGNKTKTIKTAWGTYKFDAYGEYEKVEE